MYLRTTLSMAILLATSIFAQAQVDFNTFILGIEEHDKIDPTGARQYIQVGAIEEQEDLASLEIDAFMKNDSFYGLSFYLTNDKNCKLGYFVTLDKSGFLIDQVRHTSICEIDLEKTSYKRSEGELIDGFVKVLQEEESVVYVSDTTDNLDNSETELLIYNTYYQIESDGFFTELSSPKKVNIERDYHMASQELLKTEDLESYSKNELRMMRSEILASYGHIFEEEILQNHFEKTDWYVAKGTATHLLTDLEKRNIQVIDALLTN